MNYELKVVVIPLSAVHCRLRRRGLNHLPRPDRDDHER
jgi:hypothetical protein